MLWVIRSADGTFLRDRGGESLVAGEADVTITGTGAPNPRLERYDVTQPTGRRAATGPEIADYDVAELDATVKGTLDNERLISAVVWAVIDTYSPPATIAKYQNARTKIITAYKAQPWKP